MNSPFVFGDWLNMVSRYNKQQHQLCPAFKPDTLTRFTIVKPSFNRQLWLNDNWISQNLTAIHVQQPHWAANHHRAEFHLVGSCRPNDEAFVLNDSL